MLPAEITSTAAKPRMILARNLRVGIMVRFDEDAIRPDIPTPNPLFLQRSASPEAALPEPVRKIKAETSRGGKSSRPAPRVARLPAFLGARSAFPRRGGRVAANRKAPYSQGDLSSTYQALGVRPGWSSRGETSG